MSALKIWYNNILETERLVAEVPGDCVRIGRAANNDIVLDSPYVADEAVVLKRHADDWRLYATGMNGCQVGDRFVRLGEHAPLTVESPIVIFPFKLMPRLENSAEVTVDAQREDLNRKASELIRTLHIHLLSIMDLTGNFEREQITEDNLLALERNIDEIAHLNKLQSDSHDELVFHIAAQHLRGCVVERIIEQSHSNRNPSALSSIGDWSQMVSAVPEREEELAALIEQMSDAIGLAAIRDISKQMNRLDEQFWRVWDELAPDCFYEFIYYLATRHLKKQIKDIVFGYGPLEDLLRTPTISEIMVVSSDQIYIEKNGVIENSGRQFISDDVTLTIIERIVSEVGRRIDKSQPLVDARLADGSRVNAIIPPLAVSGPCITIRKFPDARLTIDDLVINGSLSSTVVDFLRAAVIARRNILIAGGTGSGKTTLLNCLSDFVPDKERIVSIEDTAELQLQKTHVVRLESKQANVEGAGAFSIHELVKNALRMRPDRIIVGECRGREALDMLQAMNTGHDGSLTTIHANSSQDVVARLEVMVRTAADLPMDSIHRQIGSAIDLVVQLHRSNDGHRRVTQVTELVGVDAVTGELKMNDIFVLEGLDHADREIRLAPTGYLPSFLDQLSDTGLIDLQAFYR